MSNNTANTVKTVTVTEPREVTQHYENARWFTTILVEPGVYPVGSYKCGYSMVYYAKFVGKVIAADRTSTFCGNPIPSDRDPAAFLLGKVTEISQAVHESMLD